MKLAKVQKFGISNRDMVESPRGRWLYIGDVEKLLEWCESDDRLTLRRVKASIRMIKAGIE